MRDTHQGNRGAETGPASLADAVRADRGPSFGQAFPPVTLVRILILGALLVAVNYWQIPDLIARWRGDPNWSHGFLIPLFSIYLLYARWDELLAARRRICLLGLPIMVLGIFTELVGFYPLGVTWISNLSMAIILFGLVLYLGGPAIIRITWLPILYLMLAMPLPGTLYSSIALPLQNLAASWSTGILRLFGVQIEASASSLEIVSLSGVTHGVTVAEVCSGVRSLMAYVALGVAWAYLEQRPMWQRAVLVLSTVLIAVLCNVLRVTITCEMYVIDRPEWGQDFMHEFMGLLMLAPALVMFWLLGVLMQRLFVEVDDEENQEREPAEESARPARDV
jgi:exosortase